MALVRIIHGWKVWGGGVFFDPEGNLIESTYVWGLGRSTSNQEEALSICKGLKQAKERKN